MSDEKTMLSGGGAITEDHKDLKPNGQQQGYVVLTPEERRKGFIRPVRRTYIHVGIPAPKGTLRDLTPDEQRKYEGRGYAKYEEYVPDGSSVIGRFWTSSQLGKIDGGCKAETRMSDDIAETYARNPGFYGGTFCCGCGVHLPVGKAGEFVWKDAPDERVGT